VYCKLVSICRPIINILKNNKNTFCEEKKIDMYSACLKIKP